MAKLSAATIDRVKAVAINAGYPTLHKYLQVEYIRRNRTGADICRIMGVANRTLYILLDTEGFPRPNEKSGKVKYEDLDKDTIMGMLKAGESVKDCAAKYGCSLHLIYRVKKEYKPDTPPEEIEPPKKTKQEILQEQYPVAYAFAHKGAVGVRALKEAK